MPAASNGGDDRLAHTGSAVTRPAASSSGTVMAGSRAGQPAASRALRQAARARAAGTSRMNGLSVMIKSAQQLDAGSASGDPGNPWQGGGGSQPGWLATDDNAARGSPGDASPAVLLLGALRQRYRVTSTSAPASRPVASSGTMTYPSAVVRIDSSADSPKTGAARPSCSRTWTTSRRPVAEARSRSSRARTTGSAGGLVQPPTRYSSGMPISRKTTRADRGFPGSPMTGTPAHSASSVGLPGRIARPWHQMPGGPRRPTAAAVSSRAPTDEPAEITITSLVPSAARRPASSAAGSSGTMPPGRGSPPACAIIAASATAVASRTCPGRSVTVSGGTTSSPVEKTVTSGRAWTATLVTPAAASMPRSWARSGRPAGTSSAPGAASSSARTTPSPGATGRTTSMVPAIASWVYSTMITASAPGGSTPPVGMLAAVPGPTVTSGEAPIRTAPTTSR